jgi:hypothetical protein
VDLLPADAAAGPARWLICFRHRSGLWWVDLIPGRFKHVRAFGCVPECDTWVFYDPCLRTTVFLARGAGARHLMLEWSRDAAVLAMTPLPREHLRVSPFSCVTAIQSILGLPGGALRPDALYRQCLRNGAQIVATAIPAALHPADRPAA